MRNYLVGIYLTVWNSWDIHDLSSERASGKTGVPSCYHYCKYEKKVFPCWWEPPIGLTTSRYGEAITHVVQRSLCQDCPLEVGPMQSMANREALSIVSLSCRNSCTMFVHDEFRLGPPTFTFKCFAFQSVMSSMSLISTMVTDLQHDILFEPFELTF